MTASPSAPPSFDVEAVRADFPILARSVHGKPLTYLDNAASAQKPRAVIEAIRRSYEEEYANVHRGIHYLSNLATQRYEAARESARRFINAASAEEIVFTRNSTEAINLVAQSFGAGRIGEGDEIILSLLEHHSNIVPWHFYRERRGAVLKWAPVKDDGSFCPESFAKLFSSRTRLVAITQMSNALGVIVPVRDVIAIAHAHGVPVIVDGSQSAVHLDIDVQALDCDFFVFTGHKVYGPSGIGVLYGKKALLAAMPPYQGGGEMIHEVSCDAVSYAAPPHRFEAGTPAITPAIGLGAALDYVTGIGKARIAAHEAGLLAYAHDRLNDIPGLRLIGDAPQKAAIISFALGTAHPHDVATIIDRHGVAVRAGTHCAMPLLARFGVSATCRASLAMYNTRQDIDRFAQALESTSRLFG